MPTSPSKLLFLPGASGNTEFWRPAAERLAHPAQQVHIGWPGFGNTPPDPISPVRVGQRLAELLPRAELHVFTGGGHDLGFTHAAEVAGLIDSNRSMNPICR